MNVVLVAKEDVDEIVIMIFKLINLENQRLILFLIY